MVHLRLLHLLEELAGVGRKGFHVTPLALRVDRVEGEGGLPGAGNAREHGHPVPGDGHGQVVQVMFPRPAHGDLPDVAVSMGGRPDRFRRVRRLWRRQGRPGPKRLPQDPARGRSGDARHGLRRPFRDDAAAPVAALRPQVDDPVGRLDHVHVVLDDDDGVALVHEGVQHREQMGDVLEVQAGRGFVQHVHGPSRAPFAQLAAQLDALRLAARQRGRGLAQLDVSQAHVVEGPEHPGDGWDVLEQLQRFLHVQVEHVGDGTPLVLHLQGFPVEPLSFADGTGNPHVRQEIHFHPRGAVALAGFAPAAPHVEAEPSGPVAAQPGFGSLGEEGADRVEDLRVGRRVRPRRAADGRLVDIDDLVQVPDAREAVVFARVRAGLVQRAGQGRVQDVVDQRALPGTGHARHAGEPSQGEPDVQVLEVVLPGAHDREPLVVRAAAGGRNGDRLLPAQVLPGQRSGAGGHDAGAAGGHDLAPVDARARTEIHDVVGRPHGLFIVLDDDDRIALVPQLAQGIQKPPVVPGMQADARFVEHVHHADEAAADLAREAYALRLPAGERRRRAFQREVFESHVEEEVEPGDDLLERFVSDQAFGVRQGKLAEESADIQYGQPAKRGDGEAAQGDGQRFGPEAFAMAVIALTDGHVPLDLGLVPGRLERMIPLFQVGDDAVEPVLVRPLAALPVAEGEGDALVAQAEQHDPSRLFGQLVPGRVQAEPHVVGDPLEEVAFPQVGDGAEGFDRPFVDGFRRVGHDEPRLDPHHGAQAVAVRAHALEIVEGEQLRRRLFVTQVTGVAGVARAEEQVGSPAVFFQLDHHGALAQAQRAFHGLDQAGADVIPHDEPVRHHFDRVPHVAVEIRVLGEVDDLAVHPGAQVALPAEVLEEVAVLAAAPLDDRRQDEQPRALGKRQDPRDDLFEGLRPDQSAAFRAVRRPDPRIEHAQEVIDLRDRPHGGPGIHAGGLLFDGDGGRQSRDPVDVGFLHLAEELPRVGRKGFDVAPLALRVEGIEGQGGLSGAGYAGKADQRVFRQLQAHVLQVVNAGSLDLYGRCGHGNRAGICGSADQGGRRRHSNGKLLHGCLEIKVFSRRTGNRGKDA